MRRHRHKNIISRSVHIIFIHNMALNRHIEQIFDIGTRPNAKNNNTLMYIFGAYVFFLNNTDNRVIYSQIVRDLYFSMFYLYESS